eukprot:4339906-Pyramimonas_sp.AAC.1
MLVLAATAVLRADLLLHHAAHLLPSRRLSLVFMSKLLRRTLQKTFLASAPDGARQLGPNHPCWSMP